MLHTIPEKKTRKTPKQYTNNSINTLSHRRKDLTCPNKLFWQHILKELQQWQALEDKIILFMDHNEHTYDRLLRKSPADPSRLGLRKAVLQHTGKRTGATFFRGSKPISGLWISSAIEI
jgi:hypothetical protein